MIPERYLELFEPLAGIKTMLEFGNKRGTGGSGDTYKAYFERRGIRHCSIDLNGLDGALALDLRSPLNLGTFDLVSSIGTIEHVDRQEPAWRNLITSASNIVLVIAPSPGNWPGHGLWHPSFHFYRDLAEANAFVIERMYSAGDYGRALTYVRMRREGSIPFAMPDPGGLVPAPLRPTKSRARVH